MVECTLGSRSLDSGTLGWGITDPGNLLSILKDGVALMGLNLPDSGTLKSGTLNSRVLGLGILGLGFTGYGILVTLRVSSRILYTFQSRATNIWR